MALTSNLVHILLMSKEIFSDISMIYGDVINSFEARKTKELILSILARHFHQSVRDFDEK